MTQKKVALITAGGSGMGAGAARRLAADGFHVAILSSSGKGEALAGELGGFGVTGSNLDNADLARLVDGAVERWGRIDVLVNSAGHGPKGAVLDIPDEDWHKAMEIVLMPTVRAMRHIAPVFAWQKSGAAVSVSTYAAREPELTYPLSAVFRAALSGFLKLCVARHGGEGWRINAVLPGFVDNYPATPEALAKIPMGRFAAVEDELGATIAFLLSDEAGYIAGQGLLVDGGLVRAI